MFDIPTEILYTKKSVAIIQSQNTIKKKQIIITLYVQNI